MSTIAHCDHYDDRVATLRELKALPLPTLADLEPEGIPWTIRETVRGLIPASYLVHYLQPRADRRNMSICVCCGSIIAGGGTMGLLLGATFQWALAHGEFKCGKCGWPGRLYHYLKAEDGSEHRLDILLQLHPDCVGMSDDPPGVPHDR